jgi:hypothetical protein
MMITSVTNPPPMYMINLPFLDRPGGFPWGVATIPKHRKQKTDVAEHPKVFDHVGLLTNQPPGMAGLLSI